MININFFEKKERNVLPYIVGGLFFLLLFIMAIYFFFARVYYRETISDKNDWMNDQAEEFVLSKEMSKLDKQYNESVQLQEKLKESQYPMDKLSKDISASVPDELTRISSLQYLETDQLTLTLENTDPKTAQIIIESIENLPYVTGLQLLYADSQDAGDGIQAFELIIDLDEELIVEEEPE